MQMKAAERPNMFRLRTTLPAVALLLTAALVTIILWGGGSTAHATAPPTLSATQIDTDALTMAADLGDSSPTLIQHVSGTRADENQVTGGGVVPGDGASVLIAMKGTFVDSAASVPMGAQAPTGTVLTLVVDTATNTVTDFGVDDTYPDLSQLGAVTTDSASTAQSASIRRAFAPGKAR